MILITKNKINLIFYYISLLFLFLLIYLLALPIWADIFLCIILFLILRRTFQILFMSSLILFMIMLISFLPQKKDKKIYYRPTDQFAEVNSYNKNINTVMNVEFGNLYLFDYASTTFIGSDHFINRDLMKESKTVEFITDQYGYRNNLYKIETSEFILVGDSFIVGHGNTQEDIPSNQLSNLSGFAVSSIAYPGKPDFYEEIVNNSISKINNKSKIIIFYFEGNDFDKKNLSLPLNTFLRKEYINWEGKKDRILRRIYSKNNIFFIKIRRNAHKLNKKFIYTEKLNLVEIKKIGKNYVGFYKNYSSRKNITYIFKNKKILEKVIGIFFIPSKARTYSHYTGEHFTDGQFIFLKDEYGKLNIPVVDLSDLFIKKSQEALKNNEFLYWRDDSHWNSLGIKTAMSCVNDFIIIKASLRQNFKCK